MSRTFWVAVGAIGGITAYRRGERAARLARELGPLGSAQVVAASAGRFASHTASGLGRLDERRAVRQGQLILVPAASLSEHPTATASRAMVGAAPALDPAAPATGRRARRRPSRAEHPQQAVPLITGLPAATSPARPSGPPPEGQETSAAGRNAADGGTVTVLRRRGTRAGVRSLVWGGA